MQCIASTCLNVSVCLNINKKDHLLDIKALVAELYKPLPRLSVPSLAAARYDFALMSLFMGNDYLPAVKNGHISRLLPHYLALKKGKKDKAMVRWRAEGSGGLVATMDWVVFREWVVLCNSKTDDALADLAAMTQGGAASESEDETESEEEEEAEEPPAPTPIKPARASPLL